VGSDERSLSILAPKGVGLALKIEAVRTPACNIIKQLMLSLGGDAALAREVLTADCERSDVILLGSLSQIERMVGKLREYPGEEFGLKKVQGDISRALANHYNPSEFDLSFGDFTLRLAERTHIMGILNCTPDSFSDGGQYAEKEAAIGRALKLAEEGADILDIGGESTRPGSCTVSEDEELKRVIPVIAGLASRVAVPISIDTRKSGVASEALDAGASILNDVSALRFDPKMVDVVSERNVPVILMHMRGEPQTMQEGPVYSDLMSEVIRFLEERLEWCGTKGITKTIIDPGIGFGKGFEDNLTILRSLSEFRTLGRPILVGTSRKSFIGHALDLPVTERLEGTLASVAAAVLNGANIIRVHDVKEAARVAKMADTLR
jgi:dihydropteroate synthase